MGQLVQEAGGGLEILLCLGAQETWAQNGTSKSVHFPTREQRSRCVRPRRRFRDFGRTEPMPMVANVPEERVGFERLRSTSRGDVRHGNLEKQSHLA